MAFGRWAGKDRGGSGFKRWPSRDDFDRDERLAGFSSALWFTLLFFLSLNKCIKIRAEQNIYREYRNVFRCIIVPM